MLLGNTKHKLLHFRLLNKLPYSQTYIFASLNHYYFRSIKILTSYIGCVLDYGTSYIFTIKSVGKSQALPNLIIHANYYGLEIHTKSPEFKSS